MANEPNNDNHDNGRGSVKRRANRSRARSSAISISGGGNDGDGAGVAGENPTSGAGARGDEERSSQQDRQRSGFGDFDARAYGSSGSSSNGSDSGADSGNSDSGAAEDEILVRSSAPRKIKESSLGNSSSSGKRNKKSDFSAEFLGQLWGMMFYGLSMASKDEYWKLQDEDASELGEKTATLLNTMDQRKASKWLRRLEKYEPALALGFSVIAITQPRIAHTRELRKQRSQKPNGNVSQVNNGPVPASEPASATAASVQASGENLDAGVPEVASSGEAPDIDRNVGIPGFRSAPLSREAREQLFNGNG